jgi:alpha-ribazole phosphatase
MRITLVRHAEVEETYIGKYNGHIDIGLSENGQEQAIVLAKKFQNTRFDAVFCSDLKRAKETLQRFNLKTRAVYLKELREKYWGENEGKSFEEIRSSGVEYVNFAQWIEALGGESVEDFQKRIQKVFYENIFKTKKREILVVTHSGVIKTLLSLEKSISLEEAFSQNIPHASCITLRK